MSRGPGKLQRYILGIADKGEAFTLKDLLPRYYSQSEYNSMQRAVKGMRKKGLIEFETFDYLKSHYRPVDRYIKRLSGPAEYMSPEEKAKLEAQWKMLASMAAAIKR